MNDSGTTRRSARSGAGGRSHLSAAKQALIEQRLKDRSAPAAGEPIPARPRAGEPRRSPTPRSGSGSSTG